MKKIPLIVITLFSFALLNAQVEIKPGLKGGLNLANLTNTNNIGINSKGITSFHIGGTVSFKFAKFYTLQPEILYSKQGSEISSSISNSKIELNYLSIPINNKFYVGGNGLNFQIAPVIDILLSHKNVDSPESFDIALAGAIGYDIANGVNISIRYKQGLADVFGRNVNTGNGTQTTNVSDLVLNKVVQLSVGYQFDL
ncbi:outer membrane beta-barrel protein [Tamlana sp. 2201CG12-4]|uniref:outer membrane beta-barrel protein n=1 Tax=Tamlana sp. 2201CG12-4 TaxID=3112582 RepID=UPI002DB9463E|nr:outer membrane beta-barrel protein [Tamlana sp. 2201CG12-4]MEC3906107.1 outer membrane beta-barrel protein [Tamlana sp. 2201CG12-4]